MPKKKALEPRPIDKVGLKFVARYRKTRNIHQAAEAAGIPKSRAVSYFHRLEIQDEIDRQEEAVRQERAVQEVEFENLTNPLIETELIKMLRLDEKEHGTLKLDAIRLALVVNGRIKNGGLMSIETGKQADDDSVARPSGFYQAIVNVHHDAAPLVPDGTTSAVPPIHT